MSCPQFQNGTVGYTKFCENDTIGWTNFYNKSAMRLCFLYKDLPRQSCDQDMMAVNKMQRKQTMPTIAKTLFEFSTMSQVFLRKLERSCGIFLTVRSLVRPFANAKNGRKMR